MNTPHRLGTVRSLGTIRSYDELHQVLRRRADELDVSRNTLDEVAGLPAGYTGKLLGNRQVKKLGPTSFSSLLGSLGLALVVIEDTEALARVRGRLVKRIYARPTHD